MFAVKFSHEYATSDNRTHLITETEILFATLFILHFLINTKTNIISKKIYIVVIQILILAEFKIKDSSSSSPLLPHI